MKIIKLFCLLFAAFNILTGCANVSYEDKLPTASQIKSSVTVGSSTEADVRKKLGTPTAIAKLKDTNHVIYSFTFSTSLYNNAATNFGKGMATFGLGAKKTPISEKNAYIEFDENKIVKDIKVNGYTYVHKHRFTLWTEAEREMTNEELETNLEYNVDTIYDKYFTKLAEEKGVDKSALTDDEKYQEFEFCNIHCHNLRGLEKEYGKNNVEVTDYNPKALADDGRLTFTVAKR
ncbi:SmpA / OmlA family protein [Succinivibrio dextrinosolvens DSM 3072]|uniref:SmpA / OmlA family protein n=1 Tax=Succinivibrio dextrinosolvens DSM 3072 TaxID=1123324 RepID=A0A1T4VWE8_9GAMM|nr:outer membrane protein assembly factor BamE [Succinivibrio dextrinosolvens]SKA69128.1 SmpA / OmlA family protein [Succinivibrio dextrinosolvens DSM 3072]